MQAGELSDLEPGLEISFTTCEDVQSKLQEHVGRSPHNPWVFIHDITLESFHHLNDSFDTYSRSDYYHDLQLAVLYLKLASHQHSWALTHFKKLMNAKLWSAGISDFQFTWMMNKRFSGFRREKEPDDTFFPSLYVPHDAWPVLVIEVGVSETIPQLQRDAIWWFRAIAGHQVRPVNKFRSEPTNYSHREVREQSYSLTSPGAISNSDHFCKRRLWISISLCRFPFRKHRFWS